MRKDKYKIGFDIWGMILFLLIMIPNFIWFGIPAPNDILFTICHVMYGVINFII